MGVPASEAGRIRGRNRTEMKSIAIERRHSWRSLSHEDKQRRLQELRLRHQHQVQVEMLRLQQHLR